MVPRCIFMFPGAIGSMSRICSFVVEEDNAAMWASDGTSKSTCPMLWCFSQSQESFWLFCISVVPHVTVLLSANNVTLRTGSMQAIKPRFCEVFSLVCFQKIRILKFCDARI